MKGVVVGAPHGGSPSLSATLAHALSDRIGAGFVAQPMVLSRTG